MKSKSAWVHLGAAVIALAAGGTAEAQTSQGTDADIVVTAQKREQSLQDVGISIAAFGGETLKDMGISNAQQLQVAVPGLRMESPGGPASTTFTVRGVGQRDISDHNEAAVLLYNDGVYVSWIGAAGAPLFDVERVEVLKGPQGTLFGRNSTGGVISIINKKPEREFGGYIKAHVGSYSQYGVEGALNVPIGDTLAARVSFHTDRQDGYFKNSAGKDLQESENYNVRAQLRFRPNDNVDLNLQARITRFEPALTQGVQSKPLIVDGNGDIRSPASRDEFVAYCNATFPAAGAFGYQLAPVGSEVNGNCFAAGNADPYKGRWLQPKYYNRYEDYSGTLNVNLTDGLSATIISSYQLLEKQYQADDSGGAFPRLFFFDNRASGSQFTQEMRIQGEGSKYHWVLGGYYFWRVDNVYTSLDFFNNPALGVQIGSNYRSKSESSAVFFQGDYSPIDQVTITLGGRYGNDTKRIDNMPFCDPNPAFTGAVVPGFDQCQLFGTFVFPQSLQFNGRYRAAFENNDYALKAQIDVRPVDNVLIYASFNRGIKAGGFNAGAAQFYALSDVYYKPETLYAYEVGFKTEPTRGLTFNGAGFYYDYKNYQTFVLNQGAFQTLNVDAIVKGAEADLTWRPVGGLSLRASATYLDTRQKDVPYKDGFADFVMPSSPKWSLAGLARYEIPVSNAGTFALQGDVSYTAKRSTNAVDYPDLRLGAYTLVNLRASFTSANGSWEGAVFVDNVTDKAYTLIRSGVEGLTGGTTDTYARPRWFGASLQYNF